MDIIYHIIVALIILVSLLSVISILSNKVLSGSCGESCNCSKEIQANCPTHPNSNI